MSTKSYTFIPYRLQNHKLQSWKKKLFLLCSRDTTKFWRPQKPSNRIGMDCPHKKFCCPKNSATSNAIIFLPSGPIELLLKIFFKIVSSIRSYNYLFKNHNKFWDIIHSYRAPLYTLEALISSNNFYPSIKY
jgi:hypothetical protein